MTYLEHARSFPATIEDAFGRLLPAPLERIFGRRHLAIPGVRETEQDGPWGREVGQQRTIRFSDGGRATETLTSLEAPTSFGYRLSDVRGPMRLLAAEVAGEWRFDAAGTGTRITWSWDLTPTPAGRLAMPGFGPVWRGAARKAFDEIERLLVD